MICNEEYSLQILIIPLIRTNIEICFPIKHCEPIYLEYILNSDIFIKKIIHTIMFCSIWFEHILRFLFKNDGSKSGSKYLFCVSGTLCPFSLILGKYLNTFVLHQVESWFRMQTVPSRIHLELTVEENRFLLYCALPKSIMTHSSRSNVKITSCLLVNYIDMNNHDTCSILGR